MNGNSSKFAASLLTAPTSLTVLMLMTVLLMSATGSKKTSAPSAPASTGNEAKPADTTTIPVSSALQLLRDYQGSPSGFSPSTPAVDAAALPIAKVNSADAMALANCLEELKSLKKSDVGVKSMQRLKCLIALVPDPLDSHLPLTFDNAISSIVQAFRDQGFVRDRQSFLWQYGSKGTNDAAGAAPWREQPSAILFRKTASKSQVARTSSTPYQTTPNHTPDDREAGTELVLVLLVGESPTAGIHRTAFYRALDFVTANQLTPPQASRLVIPLIGPTFSGSSDSLRMSIHQWFEHLPVVHKRAFGETRLEIVSGSATATANDDLLEIEVGGDFPLKSTYRATVLPDVVSQELLLEHLVVFHGIKPNRIAMLTEDTDYGSASNSSVRQSVDPRNGEFKGIRVIPFPLSLSRMRSEYQKSEKANVATSDPMANKINVQRRNVTLESESANKAVDAIPTFSSVTPATADLAMARILETIKQEEIQAVGIMATDVQDVLFLARQVRMYSPDVLLFTTENEVLYTHSDLVGYMRGMLIASTYPLSTRVTGWFNMASEQDQADLAFPSSSAQGIYNATIGQLNTLTNSNRPLRGYRMPMSTSHGRPPLWLSVVTETGIWPISVLPTDKLNDKPQEVVAKTMLQSLEGASGQPAFSLVSISRVPSLCFALAGAVVIVLNLLQGGRRPRRGWLNNWVAQNLLPFSEIEKPVLSPVQLDRRVILTLTLLTIALAECLSISPLLLYWTSSFWLSGSRPFSMNNYISLGHAIADGVIVSFCLVVLVVSLAITLATILQLAKYIQKIAYADGYLTKLAILLALGLAWIIVVAVAVRPALGTSLELVLFLDRAGDLASGISPIMPMVAVIVAILIWSLGQWSRSCALDECYFEPPIGAALESNVNPAKSPASPTRKASKPAVGAQEIIQLVTASVGQKLEDLRQHAQLLRSKLRKQDLLFCSLVVMNVLYLYFHWVSTFEGRLFDTVFVALSGLAVAMFLIQFLHLKAICQSLLDLLRTLAQHPILPGFERAPQRLRDKVGDQLFCKAPNESDLNQQMRAFAHACQSLKIQNRPEIKSLLQSYTAMAADNAIVNMQDRDPATADDYFATCKQRWQDMCKFRVELAAITRDRIVPKLVGYWIDRDRTPAPTESESSNKSKAATDPKQAEANAELFVVISLLSIIRCAFVFMRHALVTLIGMLLCFMVAFQSYPFVIHTSLQSSLTWITCWVAASLVMVMVQLNRNEVLSRIGKSVPNRFQLDGNFVKPLLTYVALPILGLLTIQFPGLARFLFGWLGGLSQMFTM